LLDQKLVAIALLLVAVLLSATGELLLKHGMTQLGVFSFEVEMLVRIFTTPQILLGFALVFGGAIFWLAVISRVDLSFAYPMLALGYVLVVFASWLFLHEPLSAVKLLGVAVICTGVIILAQS
jgi:multidrug transporter EmrE-like cation transporter